jgi:hypothetical protein
MPWERDVRTCEGVRLLTKYIQGGMGSLLNWYIKGGGWGSRKSSPLLRVAGVTPPLIIELFPTLTTALILYLASDREREKKEEDPVRYVKGKRRQGKVIKRKEERRES